MSCTNAAGVACCGNCGHELQIVCSAGCAEPHIVFKENAITALPIPRGAKQIGRRYPTGRKRIPGICTYRACPDLVAPQEPGRSGRPHTKCAKHLAMSRKWSANVAAKKAGQ